MQSRVYLSNEQLRSYDFTVNTCNGHAINFVLSDVSDDSVGPEYEYLAYDELGYVCFYSYDYFGAFMHDEQEVEEAKNEIIKTELRLIFEVNTEETYDGLCHYYRSSLINADDSSNTCYGILDEFKRISTNEFLHFIIEDK